MLVSGVCGSCPPIQHTGLRGALDDTYSLWEVMQFRAPLWICAAVCPSPWNSMPMWKYNLLALLPCQFFNVYKQSSSCNFQFQLFEKLTCANYKFQIELKTVWLPTVCLYCILYNNKIIARVLIGQSAMVYCAGKPMEKSRVFWIII